MGTRYSNIPSSNGFPQILTLVPALEAGEAASASVTCAGQGYKALGKSPDPWTQNLRGESTVDSVDSGVQPASGTSGLVPRPGSAETPLGG